MFGLIKSKVDLVEKLEKDLDLFFKETGTNTYSLEDEKNTDGCPFCGHYDCFKVKHDPEVLEESRYKCFSCDATGSVIDWVAHNKKLSVVEAAKDLAKEYNIPLPNDYSPVQEIFEVAAGYYHTCLMETSDVPQIKLAKMTPMEYQLKVRKHLPESFDVFNMGWSDGGLIDFMESLGFSAELLIESGLKSSKTGKDFLPEKCFIYPHYNKGKVSHFTFKDNLKKLSFQLPNKFVLNDVMFFGQDSLKHFDTVIVVEGENDLISIAERTNRYAVIATIGNLSGSQLNWMRENLGSKNLITIFDPDEAGDKYREKVQKISHAFKSLVQIRPADDKDIDDLLSNGADLEEILAKNVVQIKVEAERVRPSSKYAPPKDLSTEGQGDKPKAASTSANEDSDENSDDEDLSVDGVFEQHGAYFKTRYKKGEPYSVKISNFTIRLKNVYLTEDLDRVREVLIVREDGYVSEPIKINSETKVSLRMFRTFLARAADCDFVGSDHDLVSTWSLVYEKYPEVLVKVVRSVGRNERTKSWILRDKMITDSGNIIEADSSGIFWQAGKTSGIIPEALSASDSEINRDIPLLNSEGTSESREELLKGFAHNLSKNLNDIGSALLMLSFMNASAYSNTLFNANKGFPMLFIWASNGQGKGTIGSWLMSIYNLAQNGKTTIAQLRSGIGFGRKAEYYASLPLWIDEIRADQETKNWESTFRSYYDRDPRTMAVREGFGVKNQHIRSCFMFAGEDHFEDQATKERCITVRLSSKGRETVESYRWIDSRKDELSAIGYKWILESVNENHTELLREVDALDRELVLTAKCSSRKSKMWAILGVFAIRLASRFFPQFDMKKYLFDMSAKDSIAQKSETTVSQFFETVESIISQEGIPKITTAHIVQETNNEGKYLQLWFPHVYRIVNETYHGRFAFSKNAVLAALREEPYFVSDTRKVSMGLGDVRRTVVTLDLDKAPDVIRNIAEGVASNRTS